MANDPSDLCGGVLRFIGDALNVLFRTGASGNTRMTIWTSDDVSGDAMMAAPIPLDTATMPQPTGQQRAHDEIGVLFTQVMSESDAFLLGRKTWQINGSAFEPMEQGDPFGDQMKAIPKYVDSTTLATTAAWRNSTLISGDAVASIPLGSSIPRCSNLSRKPGRKPVGFKVPTTWLVADTAST